MSSDRSEMPVVAVQSLTKVFRDFWMRTRARAVDGVSFEVYPGETFGLLGPNGSGKSTTIKIILGLLKPTSGRVAVLGKPAWDVATKRRIGYLPEESYLYAFLNARETLEYYAKLFQLDPSTRRRRIDELLDMVGLSAVQFRPVREYSKGMQRRIGIAQALINDPDLLILDEPTTGLDPIGARQMKDLILELGRRKKTIILSSHVLADVEDTAHRMVILYGGKIREEGTCDSLLAREDKSVIETDALDDATIAEIDKVVRARTGGRASVLRVGKGRQKLEEKFVAIVERASAERAATSGAQHTGQTAGFLKDGAPGGGGGGGEQAEGLIERLVVQTQREEADRARVASEATARDAATAARAAEAAGPDRTLLGDLVNPAAGTAPGSPASPGGAGSGGPAGASSAGPAVDADFINSLTREGPGTPGGPGAAGGGGRP